MRLDDAMKRWEETVRGPSMTARPQTREVFKTLSGQTVKPLYTPLDLEGIDYLRDIGFPGQYPFTRGRTPNGYRAFKWPHDFYSGYGSGESANQRYRELVKHGATVITLALDLPTQIGLDSTDTLAEGEVGKAGVALASLADAERVLDGVDLARTGLGFVANAIGPYALAIALAVAEKRGLDPADLRHFRIQNDPLKEFTGRNTHIFPVPMAVELATDVVEHINRNYKDKWLWQWVPQYVCSTQMRWGGMNAAQEVGFMLAHFFTYVDSTLARGLPIASVVSKMEWHASTDLDLFEEVAKYRAGRRLFARLMKERYQCDDPEVLGLRVSTWTTGDHLTAQQPLNNLARISMSVLAAFLGGAEHIWAPAYDEALALPTSESTRIANQVKYIIHHECGLENTVDPLAGSYFVEKLTDELEADALEYFRKIDALGGMVSAIERGFPQREIQESAYRFQKAVERKEKIIVGVNEYVMEERPIPILYIDERVAEAQTEGVRALRASRDGVAVDRALARLKEVARGSENLMYPILDAARAYATLGEMCDALREVWGEYQEPPVF